MRTEVNREIGKNSDGEWDSRPSANEFEMAYQSRIAIDQIRFAIKAIELFGPRIEANCEVGMKLLDALNRLETIDRRFQERSRGGSRSGQIEKLRAHSVVSTLGKISSHESGNEACNS